MAFKVKNSIHKIQAYLNASGYLSSSEIGEPKSPPQAQEQGYASVSMQGVSTVEVFCDGGTTEVHTILVRLYKRMFNEPEEQLEYLMAEMVASICSDILADADLGSEVRNISVGQFGEAVGAVWGYAEVGGVNYRIVDIQLPLIVDNSTTVAP